MKITHPLGLLGLSAAALAAVSCSDPSSSPGVYLPPPSLSSAIGLYVNIRFEGVPAGLTDGTTVTRTSSWSRRLQAEMIENGEPKTLESFIPSGVIVVNDVPVNVWGRLIAIEGAWLVVGPSHNGEESQHARVYIPIERVVSVEVLGR